MTLAAERHYQDLEDCLVSAYEEGARQLERTFREGLHASVPRTTIPSLRERHLESRQRIVTVLSEERGPEAGEASRLHLELVTGAAHHSVGAQMTAERCDLASIRARMDDLISDYVPVRS